MLHIKLLFIFLFYKLIACEYLSYENYTVYELKPKSDDHIKLLLKLEHTSDNLIYLEYPRQINQSVVIIVPPQIKHNFHNLIELNNIEYLLLDDNLHHLVKTEHQNRQKRSTTEFGWKNYHTLTEIYDWMSELVKKYPNYLTTFTVGYSHENREIRGLKISYKEGNPGVFIEGGIHAREWISPATVTYIVNQFVTSNITEIRLIAEKFDWYVVPVVNVDGFVYSHDYDRFWRKNRKRTSRHCYGVDLNRNWDHHWMEEDGNTNPCSTTYSGTHPLSEIEIKSLADYLLSIKNKIKTVLSFHSKSQLLLFPYGYTSRHTQNHNDLLQIGNRAINALNYRYNTEYFTGNVFDIYDPVSASTMDWAYDNLDSKIVYTFELRPKVTEGLQGYVLSTDKIIPVGQETLDSVLTILNEADLLGYYKTV